MVGNETAQAGIESWQIPDYVNPEAFADRDVTVGFDELAVAGVLSVPLAPGPHPAVVILAGGGAFDRDGTVGPNRIYRDIAEGLACRGIATLRFDKVTLTHADAVAEAAEFTVRDEYLPHALAAIEILRATEGIDANRIHVVGHSMGGRMAPRVAEAAPEVAGIVTMAGDTAPMWWAVVRVLRHLAEIDPAAIAALPPVETVVEQAKRVDSAELSLATPTEDLPFGQSAAYWLDLRAYDPVAVAATLDIPMLILQGERDYQVTVEDDLALWRAGLAGRANVDIRTYPADDHLFFPGDTPSRPADYAQPHHVDGEVVADIAQWIMAH